MTSRSEFHVELWPLVIIPHWIVIPIPGHNLTLNNDSGSKFNVELRPQVIIQRGIKTQGHNSTRGPNFIRRRGRNTMTPCLGGSQFNMKNPLNPEHSPLNQDPKGRNSMGSKFNLTPADNTSGGRKINYYINGLPYFSFRFLSFFIFFSFSFVSFLFSLFSFRYFSRGFLFVFFSFRFFFRFFFTFRC